MSGAARRSVVRALAEAIGSMKLSVVLLVLLGVLTWLGTLAQVEKGLWLVQKEYFESWWVIYEYPARTLEELRSAAADDSFRLKIPLPGAYVVMVLLFVNLLVGGLLRLKWRWRNGGVLTIHIGIALLLAAGFVKVEFSTAGGVWLFEEPADGAARVPERVYATSTSVSFHDYELALLVDRGGEIEERTVPESTLWGARGDGRVTLAAEGLPFVVEVHDWFDNCDAVLKGPMVQTPAPVLDNRDGGPGVCLLPRPVATQREANTAGCYVDVVPAAGARMQGLLRAERGDSMTTRLPYDGRRFPFVFEVDGVRYGLDLRRVHYDLPFGLRLKRFVKTDHPGTMTAADYRSTVLVEDGGTSREVQIFMNNPLRKDGYTVYQTSWGPQMSGRPIGNGPWYSAFEVSRNPSDQWPLYACIWIAIGLLWHFLAKLFRFLNSSAREALSR
ncbi:MAG TPA: hypothetical protein ENI87_15050 [bacterium]|nr:hypothetical protein [bacterium]